MKAYLAHLGASTSEVRASEDALALHATVTQRLLARAVTAMLGRVARGDAVATRKRTKRTDLAGVLVIDKPRGPTSHDVVARIRRAFGVREIGHAGTLDPMATGVLVVAVGEATKLVPYLTAADKSYDAAIAFGVATDTLDAEGAEIARADVPNETMRAIKSLPQIDPHLAKAIASELSRTRQIPPVYSALNIDGERAHVRARRGEVVEMEARDVIVRSLRVEGGGVDPNAWLAIALDVGKGYYVRSFARDLAEALGTVGHLTALRRTRSGPFTIDEGVPLDAQSDELEARIIPLARAAARSLPVAHLTEIGVRDARFGRAISKDDLSESENGPHAWLDRAGHLIAIGDKNKDGLGRVLRGFADPVATSSS